MEEIDGKKYQVCGKVVVRKIGDETLLVPVSGVASGGRVFPLNETALFIWSRVTEGKTFGETVHALAEAYRVEETEAHEDCNRFIAFLVSENLLEEEKV